MGGQNYQVVGIEWLVTAGIAAGIYINGYVQAGKSGQSTLGLTLIRLVFGTALYLIEISGALIFILGYRVGLYLAAITMVILLAYTITGAWLLVVGVYAERTQRPSKK